MVPGARPVPVPGGASSSSTPGPIADDDESADYDLGRLMTRHLSAFLLLGLAACYTTNVSPDTNWTKTTFTGPGLAQPAEEEGEAPDSTTLPIGVGLTLGPKTMLVGATLDFPLDKKITFGPSLQYGFDNDASIATLTGQLKYFLPVLGEDKKSFSMLPYLTLGVGAAQIDKDGWQSDTSMVINGGVGLRYLTGDHYRIGSEARLNLMTEEINDERAFLSIELLQVIISF